MRKGMETSTNISRLRPSSDFLTNRDTSEWIFDRVPEIHRALSHLNVTHSISPNDPEIRP